MTGLTARRADWVTTAHGGRGHGGACCVAQTANDADMTPTARSLKVLRQRGATPAVVERWKTEVDHAGLIRRLIDNYRDGWALSCSSPSTHRPLTPL